MSSNRLSRILGTGAAAFLVFLTLAPAAKAETISVTPPKFELLGDPGDTLTETIRVTNTSDTPETYQTDIEDFTASGDEGGVSFVDDPNAPQTTYSLAKWMTAEPSRLTVDAGDEKDVTVTIKIPSNGEPGSHFASVQIALVPDSANPGAGSATVESKLNTLVLLRVSGDVTESLSLDRFSPTSAFNQKGPIDFVLRTTNKGNVHVAPAGTITITDTFGNKVATVPLTENNVLPGASRIADSIWDPGTKIGKFTATLVSTYGEGKEALTAVTTFYIIPVSLIIWSLIGIVVLVLLITRRKSLKKLLNRLTSD
jgi:hypothetical protein